MTKHNYVVSSIPDLISNLNDFEKEIIR